MANGVSCQDIFIDFEKKFDIIKMLNGGDLLTTGERIKELRINLGLSQEELGEIIGVKKAAIHKYENNIVVNLKRSTIQAIADALDVAPAYLMGWTDDSYDYEKDIEGRLASLPRDLLDAYNGDAEKAYRAKQAIDEDSLQEYQLAREADSRGYTLQPKNASGPDNQKGQRLSEAKQSSAQVSEAELNSSLVKDLVDLSPQEANQVRAFVAGLKAAREAEPSHRK